MNSKTNVNIQRFLAGLREMAFYRRAKALGFLTCMVAMILAWVNRGVILTPIFGGVPLVYHTISLSLSFVGVVVLLEIIIIFGTPMGSAKIQNALVEAGFTNSTRLPPLLLSIRKVKQGRIYEFDQNNIPLSRWERDKEKIGAALHGTVLSVQLSKNGRRVILQAVPINTSLPEKINWKNNYLSQKDFVLVLGMGLGGNLETIDLASTPHILLGGSTGSGKSLLLKCVLMQTLKKAAVVILADFKGGVDYAPIWHRKCQMVFDQQELLEVLEKLAAELERRRALFVAAGTPSLTEYNQVRGERLQRYILTCDEVAEILDKTGLSKEEKAVFAQIERHLSLIARQGRAFGLHLIFATQRPSAELIPGQIRTNLTLRICGRADDILSRIILDDATAADRIPPDARGRFITNMGQIFQGFLFDDNILEE